MKAKLKNSHFKRTLLAALIVSLSSCGIGQLKDERDYRFPKSFKGSVSGNFAEGKGNYSSDGITLRGDVSVTKSSAKKIKVTNATLNLTSAEKSCKLIFSGNGSKVV